MTVEIIAAYVFCVFTILIVMFQVALILGVPWGEMTMGGKFPDRLPYKIRTVVFVQLLFLLSLALVVLSRARILLEELFAFSQSAIWFVVILYTLSATLNIITPSKKERKVWAPITLILLFCSFIVAKSSIDS